MSLDERAGTCQRHNEAGRKGRQRDPGLSRRVVLIPLSRLHSAPRFMALPIWGEAMPSPSPTKVHVKPLSRNSNTRVQMRKNEKITRGRPFPKGNPGRPKGSKNRATLAAE